MSCSNYPTAQTANTFKLDAITENERVTLNQDRTNPASDGNTKKTMWGMEQDAKTQLLNFESTFSAQFTYKKVGNISNYVGDELQAEDKLNAYMHPDDSDFWYAPLQGQAFPITIPDDPASSEEWVSLDRPASIEERVILHTNHGGNLLTRIDDLGNSHVMVRIPAFTNRMVNDALGTNWQPASALYPAFIGHDGSNKQYFEIAIYIASDADIVGLESQPYKRSYNANYSSGSIQGHRDKITSECGEGWHICGAAQWAAVSLWCLINGYQPSGNTANGTSHDNHMQRGIMREGFIPGSYYANDNPSSLVGTGPNEWRHDNSPTGIADLVGHAFELTDGVKLVDGQFFAADRQAQDESEWLTTGSFIDYNRNSKSHLFNNGRTEIASNQPERWGDISKSETYEDNQLLQQLLIEPTEATAELKGHAEFYSRDTQRVFRGGHFKSYEAGGLAAMRVADSHVPSSLRLCYFHE